MYISIYLSFYIHTCVWFIYVVYIYLYIYVYRYMYGGPDTGAPRAG